MIPLLFAAAVASAPASPSITTFAIKGDPTPACAKLLTETVAPDGTPYRRLDQLPPKVEEHAVWRMVGGCPVREVVWNGQTYYVEGSNPVVDRGPLAGGRLQYHSVTPEQAPSH